MAEGQVNGPAVVVPASKQSWGFFMKLAMTSLTVVTAVALGTLFTAAPAQAWYKICNKTKSSVDAAFGYQKDGDWVSEGWWNISPGKCKTVYSGDLEKQKYYFYAESTDGDYEWDGDYPFCTIDKEFTIVGDTNCKSRGYKSKKFREVDVGDSSDWTSNLE
jgi:uncharacterized membrane protein